jgi:serine/threonine protein kinase
MGEVWLAQDERLLEPVALKFLPPEIRSDVAALDDLRRETARSHKLTHSNIVRIHDLHEEDGGLAFIAMEYVDGPTLSSLRVDQQGRVLAWDQIKPLVEQLCAALDYAHGEKVIHRDLKPGNIMVDSKGRLKLADFGIAATVSDSVSRVSGRQATSGTLPYMSPQQLAGKRPQVTDDIYALGATLYELLSGKPPFYTGDITHQVLHEPPEPLEERMAGLEVQNLVPPDVAAIVMACLAKEPAQRPQSARAVAEWIGLEVVRKPSMESLAEAMFPKSDATRGDAEVEVPASEAPGPTAVGRRLALVGGGVVAAILLTGAGVWYFVKHRAGSTPQPTESLEVNVKLQPPAASAASSPPIVSSAPSLPPDDSEDGFVSLFNGRDLSGWKGDSKAWSVRDGAIVGKVEGAVRGDHLLTWTGGELGDFELRFAIKQPPDQFVQGMAGIRFLAKLDAEGELAGYNVDLYTLPGNHCELREVGLATQGSAARGVLAKAGQRTVARASSKAEEISVVGRVATTSKELEADFKKADWNEVTIRAQTNRICCWVNGHLMLDCTDDNPVKRHALGSLALKLFLNRGPAVTAQVRELRLKRLTARPARELASAGSGRARDAGDSMPDFTSLKYGLYIHFDISTFAGYIGAKDLGKVPAERFAPSALDVRGWARTAKEAGMTFAVLTAKHEAGFCLWPAKDYDYSVASSPVKTDIVADFIAACKDEGIVPGVHYSIPDAHNEGAVRFNGPVGQVYFNLIKKHITDLHSRHPELGLQVFDGGTRFSPDQFKELCQIIKRFNPQCVIMGTDDHEFGPAYDCATVNEGWLWSPNARILPANQLYNKYAACRAQSQSFLLNVGPDTAGRIPDSGVAVLMEMKKLIGGQASSAQR